MLSVVMLNVVMLCVVMLNVIMLNVVAPYRHGYQDEIFKNMLNLIMLNVIMLNVVAPCIHGYQDKIFMLSCKIFEHFALQVDPVIEFIQLGSFPFQRQRHFGAKTS